LKTVTDDAITLNRVSDWDRVPRRLTEKATEWTNGGSRKR